jgi:hypothetical protein
LTVDEDKSITASINAKPDALQRGLLFFIIFAFLVLSTLYSFSVPIYEAQDEKPHFEFIRFIAKEARLPDFRRSEDANTAGIQSIQTPLYYLFQGALLRISGESDIDFAFEKNPIRSKATPAIYYHNSKGERFPYQGKFRAFHLLRFTNIVVGILILLVVYKTVSLIVPAETCLPVAATGFVVLIPQFTYICATISNDAFSILFGSLTLYFLLRFVLSASMHLKEVLLISVSVSLAVLSKQMTLCLIPVCYVAVLVKGDVREKAKNLAAMTIVISLLAGWYYARNWLLFGDVLNLKTQMEEFSFLLVERKTLAQFFGVYFPSYFVPRFIKSFWGSFGYTTVWMGWSTYLFYSVVAGAGLISCATGILDPDFRSRFSKEQKIGLALLVLSAAMLLAQILAFNFTLSQPQGRYGFSALCCLAIFWALGMERLVKGKRAHKRIILLVLTLLLILINFCALRFVLNKAFSPPPSRIDVMQEKGASHLLTLNQNNVVGQTFRCGIDNLDLVAVKFHARGEYRNCQVVFRIKSAATTQSDLARVVVPGNAVQQGAFHFFTFPALENSKGKDYLFLLEAVDERGFAGISCFHTEDDAYEGGNAIDNGRPLAGDLTFITGSS